MFDARSNWHKENLAIVHLPSGLRFTYNTELTLLPCKTSHEQYQAGRLEHGVNQDSVDTEILRITTQAENIVWREALAFNP